MAASQSGSEHALGRAGWAGKVRVSRGLARDLRTAVQALDWNMLYPKNP